MILAQIHDNKKAFNFLYFWAPQTEGWLMDYFSLIIIALGLSMDSFAVSVVNGLMMPRMKFAFALYVAFFLAFFQAFMPVVGYFAGTIIEEEIKSIDHWLAFILLSIIGAKMVFEGTQSNEYVDVKQDYQLSLKGLISQSIATSIDALAIGITLAFLQTNIWFASFIIGAITFFISMIGLRMGKAMGMKLRGKLEIIGGIFLFGIGLKIVLEHLFFS